MDSIRKRPQESPLSSVRGQSRSDIHSFVCKCFTQCGGEKKTAADRKTNVMEMNSGIDNMSELLSRIKKWYFMIDKVDFLKAAIKHRAACLILLNNWRKHDSRTVDLNGQGKYRGNTRKFSRDRHMGEREIVRQKCRLQIGLLSLSEIGKVYRNYYSFGLCGIGFLNWELALWLLVAIW